MDNLGSQVGQKMRSAVKAKLIELGTGGATGYIDDELPDYVMIMVANKRSKQQMIADLNLFLGSQTELFVTWLHEVLQKLQEVTLPASVTQKRKRKLSEIESSVTTKKEKKEKKKEKKLRRSDKSAEISSHTISDVFANHLLEQAKKSAPLVTASKKEIHSSKNTDDFDIPTITEISEQSSEKTRKEKDLTELAELQKKINQAKRHLKGLEIEESEDEDFLNIKEDAEEFEEIVTEKNQRKNKERSPIVFNSSKESEETKENQDHHNDHMKMKKHTPITFSRRRGSSDENDMNKKRKSIHDRLGYKSSKNVENVSVSAHRRSETETSVPSFRRRDSEKRHVKKTSENKEQTENNIEIDKTKIADKLNIKRRIGSRIIVAPPKIDYKDDDEEIEDRSINSLIKIKPRPIVSPSKQASKNLLLRAVAEAQKSTALVKPQKEYLRPSSPPPVPQRVQKLYTKSYRNRNRDTALQRASKDNIVIEVNAEKKSKNKKHESEYISEEVSDKSDSDSDFTYVPQIVDYTRGDFCIDGVERNSVDNRGKTQFVVTLDEKTRDKYISKHTVHMVERNTARMEVRARTENNNINSQINRKVSQQVVENFKSQRSVKKIIIQNDSEDDDSLSPLKDKDKLETRSTLSSDIGTSKKRWSAVSPITFDLESNYSSKRRSRSGERDVTRTGYDEDKMRVSIRKVDTFKKYDNIPELLSSVPVDSSAIKSKQKERCKYFPSCGKGDSCDFHHPSMPCKAFPNCKFADKCLYLHPKCKFDLTCNRSGCNFSHSVTTVANVAPPLSSHVVPVQNYKSITAAPLPAMCKYYPNCTNTMCNFYHPKLCRFGKNCMNKVECNFYHHDLPNKDRFKWVASLG